MVVRCEVSLMVEAVVWVDASFGLFLGFEVTGWWCRCHSNKNK